MKNYIKRILSTLLICCLCFSVVGCSNGEEILSVYSEVETVNGGNISEDKETVSSGSQNDSVSTNSSSSSNNANGKFDPYAGIEKYRGKELTFAVWWNMSDQEKKPIQDFYKKYGIKVNVEVIPNESYGSKTASEIASGNGPDIVGTSGEGHLNIIHKGLVQPIDVGCYDLENDDAYDLDVMKALSWKGKMYGINLRNNMTYQRWCIYFNKTMFDNQGVTDP